jgi:hypothetical protein
MKYLHSLIPFLPILLNDLRLPTQETPSILSRLALDLRYIASGRIQQKTPFRNNSSTYRGVFTSPLHRNGSSSIVVCVFISAGTWLPSFCLAMNVYSSSAIPAFRRHVTISFFMWMMYALTLCTG